MGLTACLDGLPRLLCACRLRRKGLATRQSQAYPASAGGPSPQVSPRRHHATGRVLRRWRAGVRWQESILGSVRCGGTGLPQALGLFVSLPIIRAIARLLPSVCGTLPPREGGLHARLSHRDWLLVGSDIRLRAGVLSHWLRGRQPATTQEQFQQRWCHGDALCSLPEDMQEPPIIHWTAMHPVPLPQ